MCSRVEWVCWLCAQFLVKLTISPCRAKFLFTMSSMTELFVNVSFWVQYVLLTWSSQTNSQQSAALEGLHLDIRFFHGEDEHESELRVWALNRVISYCNMAQSLRVFRIFKSSRINSGLRVLILTVKKSITELALLGTPYVYISVASRAPAREPTARLSSLHIYSHSL